MSEWHSTEERLTEADLSDLQAAQAQLNTATSAGVIQRAAAPPPSEDPT
jgi:hypothetical protein